MAAVRRRLAWLIWRTTPVVCITETLSFIYCQYGRRIGRVRLRKVPVAVGPGSETRRLGTEPWLPYSELQSPFGKARLSSLVTGILPAGTAFRLIREREKLRRMFSCSCCLCRGSCGLSGPLEGLGPAVPSSLLDLEASVPEGLDKLVRQRESRSIRTVTKTPILGVLRLLPTSGPMHRMRTCPHLLRSCPLLCN